MSNIFKTSKPATIELPFVTIEFMGQVEPLNIQRFSDLPSAGLNWIDARTSEVHAFYLRIKPVENFDATTIDMARARELVTSKIEEAIKTWGEPLVKEFTPQYPQMAYRHDPGTFKMVLVDNAEAIYMQAVAELALPVSNHRLHRPDSEFTLSGQQDRICLSVQLSNGLKLRVTQSKEDAIYGGIQGDARSIIRGTATLLGKPATVSVSAENQWHLGSESALPISQWLREDILKDEIHGAVNRFVEANFGASAGTIQATLLSNLSFGSAD